MFTIQYLRSCFFFFFFVLFILFGLGQLCIKKEELLICSLFTSTTDLLYQSRP